MMIIIVFRVHQTSFRFICWYAEDERYSAIQRTWVEFETTRTQLVKLNHSFHYRLFLAGVLCVYLHISLDGRVTRWAEEMSSHTENENESETHLTVINDSFFFL